MNQIVEIETAPEGLPLTHTFSEGVYAREIFMPKGMIVVGHMHKTRHLNIVSTGKAKVWYNGEVHEVVAPITFESEPNQRKVLYIEEDMFWTTIHITDETDVGKLEDILIDKSNFNRKEIEDAIDSIEIKMIGE
jgi:quercetin dioxygenase-like cupin family protein